MKKVINTLGFVVQTTSAQLTKDLGEFSTIKIYDRLTVSLISSSENKIVITGNRESEVEGPTMVN
jgi:hypothetical protein